MTRNPSLGKILCLVLPVLCGPLLAMPVRVLAWDEQVAAMRIALVDGSEFMEVTAMHPSKRTRAYEVTPGPDGIFLEMVGKKTADGKPVREKLAIPPNVTRPLVLVLPDGKSASGVRLHVIEDDVKGFPWGSTRLVNSTGKKLVFAAEKKAVEVPATWTPVLVDPGGAERNIEVKLFFREKPEKSFYSAVWQYKRDIRTLVFLVPGSDPRLGPVAMKMIPEDRLAKEPESASAGQ